MHFLDRLNPEQRDAVVHVDVDARDFQTTGRDNVDEPDPDLDCEYLGGPSRQELDVAAWARDCVVEAMPNFLNCAMVEPNCVEVQSGVSPKPGVRCQTNGFPPRKPVVFNCAQSIVASLPWR